MAQPRTRFSKHGKDDPENQMGLERDVMNSVIICWWFGTCFIFHNIWDVILPIDFHIFQDGYCTTNQLLNLPTSGGPKTYSTLRHSC